MSEFVIRQIKHIEELEAVEALQRLVWDAPSAVIYQHMLISFVHNGGSVLGAFTKNNQLVGFLISYLGIESPEADRPAMANLKLVSQRMAIMPEYRNSGIGYDLKMAQRDFALKMGIRLITWTYDPLLSRNAHLNIRKLGAIVREYYRDFYGTKPSPLVKFETSDRLLVEWWITNNRVEQRINGKRGALTLLQYLEANAPILNPSRQAHNGFAQPSDVIMRPENSVILIEVPDNYDRMITDAPDLARAWRFHCRQALEGLLASGYAITDFVHTNYEGRPRSFYALSYAEYSDFQLGSRFSTN